MTVLAVWSFPFFFCWNPNNRNFTWVREEFPDEGDGWSDADGTVVDERRACNPSVTDCRRPCVLRYKDVVPPERVLSNSSHTILLIFSVAESFSLMLLNKINKQNSDRFFRSYVFFFSRLIHTEKILSCVTAFNSKNTNDKMKWSQNRKTDNNEEKSENKNLRMMTLLSISLLHIRQFKTGSGQRKNEKFQNG